MTQAEVTSVRSGQAAIVVEDLRKAYGSVQAVKGIGFRVNRGEIYGLLGPNGAGKTTTLSMMAGILKPDEGRILYEDLDLHAEPRRVKARLGVVPQETALYEELTARENARFWGALYGLTGKQLSDAVEDVLARVGLSGRANQKVRAFSGGLKRRLNLALGLVHRPSVVLMDEPTVGIDPQARINILDVVRQVASQGTTVLYTTHYLEEAERLCDRVAIMDHGKILAEGTLQEMKDLVGQEEIITIRGSFDEDQARRLLDSLPRASVEAVEAGRLVVSVPHTGRGAAETLAAIFGSDLPVDGVSIEPPSLHGLFLKLTGREMRD